MLPQHVVTRYLCVVLGGAAGSSLRYFLSIAISTRWPTRFPLATFLINVTGSFCIGAVLGLLGDRPGVHWRALLVAGFLGGYTTFSAFEWELFRLGRTGLAALYALSSVVAGLLLCWLGSGLGKTLAKVL